MGKREKPRKTKFKETKKKRQKPTSQTQLTSLSCNTFYRLPANYHTYKKLQVQTAITPHNEGPGLPLRTNTTTKNNNNNNKKLRVFTEPKVSPEDTNAWPVSSRVFNDLTMLDTYMMMLLLSYLNCLRTQE